MNETARRKRELLAQGRLVWNPILRELVPNRRVDGRTRHLPWAWGLNINHDPQRYLVDPATGPPRDPSTPA